MQTILGTWRNTERQLGNKPEPHDQARDREQCETDRDIKRALANRIDGVADDLAKGFGEIETAAALRGFTDALLGFPIDNQYADTTLNSLFYLRPVPRRSACCVV